MNKLLEWKFILPTLAIVLGAAMVWTDRMDGQAWAMMSTTLITGFYAITGWGERQAVDRLIVEKTGG